MSRLQYLSARIAHASEAALPAGKNIARGWSAVRLGAGRDRMELVWPAPEEGGPNGEATGFSGDGSEEPGGLSDSAARKSGRLRISVALDYRDAQQVDVYLLRSGQWIGSFDIRYAYGFQPFELVLSAETTSAVLNEGVRLELRGGSDEHPLWVFDALDADCNRVLFAPHLLIGEPESVEEQALRTMLSLHSLQPFGWMEGCVLDGLLALRSVLGAERVDPALDLHFGQFFGAQGELLYEDLEGRKADDTFTTIEATLPLAVIARYRQDHPVIGRAIAFFESRGLGSGDVIIDEDMVSAEGSYTVAYPLAVIANRLDRRDLAEQAVAQVLLRRDYLAQERHVYLRYMLHTQEHTFRSWARAFSWYFLGLVNTCVELRSGPFANMARLDELEAEIARIAETAAGWRQPNGLWSCFLDDPATGIDTSGSAGISAAMALAASHGLLPDHYMEIARHSLRELSRYLTPDGLMRGVAQHNAGGLELQRCGYRVISQMGLGLWAQLYAYACAGR